MNNSYVLQAQALSCERGDRLLFENLNFELHNGQGLHIVGANGSGKTSLLHMLAGLSAPITGSISWNKVPIYKCKSLYATNSCLIGHIAGVSRQLTPRENCRFIMQLRHINTSDRQITQALERVELAGFEDEMAGTLSAGQQRRIALAQLILNQSPLWLLDEPYTALDKLGIQILDDLCEQHIKDGGLLIFASHQASALDDNINVQQILLER